MASPQAIQQWAGLRRVDRPQGPYGQRDAAASVLRLAWVGRTSTCDQQDPTLSLPRQLRKSHEAPSGRPAVPAPRSHRPRARHL
jgi:hypothetical protein